MREAISEGGIVGAINCEIICGHMAEKVEFRPVIMFDAAGGVKMVFE